MALGSRVRGARAGVLRAKSSPVRLFFAPSSTAWPDGSGGGGEWLHFRGVTDLALISGGVIDGRGHWWWARSCKAKNNSTENFTSEAAPKALHFENCQDVSAMGITLQNSQQSHLTFTRCSHVKANYLRITSPEDSPDTIGVQIVMIVSQMWAIPLMCV